MKDDEIREFLMRWLMEFGTEPVPWATRCNVNWYWAGSMRVDMHPLKKYFMYASTGDNECQLNQAGLNFIKEK